MKQKLVQLYIYTEKMLKRSPESGQPVLPTQIIIQEKGIR